MSTRDRCGVDLNGSQLLTVVVGRFAPVVRRGLLSFLSEDRLVRVLASDVDSAALEQVVLRRAPSVAIVNEPKECSILMRLQAVQPATRILVLAHDPSPAYGMRMLAAGATCVAGATCLASSEPAVGVLEAVRVAAQGRRIFVPAEGACVERCYPSGASGLRPREREVLEGLSRNESNGEIALAMGIGIETVKTHVGSVLHKLKVQRRQDLVGVPTTPPDKHTRGGI